MENESGLVEYLWHWLRAVSVHLEDTAPDAFNVTELQFFSSNRLLLVDDEPLGRHLFEPNSVIAKFHYLFRGPAPANNGNSLEQLFGLNG